MHVRVTLYLLFCALVSSNFFFAAVSIHPCFLFCVKCKIKATHATRKKNILTNTIKSWAHARKSSFHFFFLTFLLVVFDYNSFWRSTSTFSIQSLLRLPWQDINFISFPLLSQLWCFQLKKEIFKIKITSHPS